MAIDMTARSDEPKHEEDPAPVYVASYDHLGIVLWTQRSVERHFRVNLDRLTRFPDYRIGWDHEAFTYDYLAEHAPDLLREMRTALGQFKGRLGIGSCTYGQPLSAFIDGESNIRQLTMAMDATEKHFGWELSVYVMSEHPFHAQLPQLLAGCGFKGAVLRTHFMMYGHNPEFDAPVCWWRGVDGSRIAAIPTYRGQGATRAMFMYKIPGATSTMDNRILTDSISERCRLTMTDFRRAFGGRIRPLVATRADDPRSEESLIRTHVDDAGVKWMLLEDIFALLPQPRAELRTEANDFKPRMPWGYCGNWIWNKCREAEVRAETAERMAAIGHALGGPAYEDEAEGAWKNLLVAQHHDIQICGLEDDARRYLGESLGRSDRIIENVLCAVAPRIGRGRRSVVFNPLPWERTEWTPLESGGLAVTVPGLGFREVRPEESRSADRPFDWQPEARDEDLQSPVFRKPGEEGNRGWAHDRVGRLATPFYEAFTAEKGGFRLLRDRKSGRNLWNPPKTSGTLAGLVGGRDSVSAGGVAKVDLEPDRAVMTEKGEVGGIPYICTWTFYRHSPRIDWHGEVLFNGEFVGRPKEPIPAGASAPAREEYDRSGVVTAFNDHEYKLRLRFYPYHATPRMVGIRDLPFHIAETSDSYVEGLYWTAVSDGNVGVALFNRGLMGSVYEKDGAFSSVLAFSLPYVWGNRFLKGTYSYDLGILPFEGDWREADLHRQAMEFNFPFLARVEEKSGDTLGEVWTPYRETGDGQAILSALYTRKGQLHARFHECRGGTAEVGFEWLGAATKFTSTDLRERPRAELGSRAILGPWQVQTLSVHSQV